MTCLLCNTPLKFRKYDYFNIIKIVHEKCKEDLEKEAETIQRQANIQKIQHRVESGYYAVQRLIDNAGDRKGKAFTFTMV